MSVSWSSSERVLIAPDISVAFVELRMVRRVWRVIFWWEWLGIRVCEREPDLGFVYAWTKRRVLQHSL
jgi:hypothetical protein